MQVEKEGDEASLFADDDSIHKRPADSTRKLLELVMNSFSQVAGNKMNKQMSILQKQHKQTY